MSSGDHEVATTQPGGTQGLIAGNQRGQQLMPAGAGTLWAAIGYRNVPGPGPYGRRLENATARPSGAQDLMGGDRKLKRPRQPDLGLWGRRPENRNSQGQRDPGTHGRRP